MCKQVVFLYDFFNMVMGHEKIFIPCMGFRYKYFDLGGGEISPKMYNILGPRRGGFNSITKEHIKVRLGFKTSSLTDLQTPKLWFHLT